MVTYDMNRWKCYIKKNVRCIILVISAVIIIVVGIFCYVYFNASAIQNKLKERICDSVKEQESDLLEIVNECKKRGGNLLISDKENEYNSICFEDLDSETINEIFKTFKLVVIYKMNDETISFTVKPSIINALWDGYRYGFYYAEIDRPVNVFGGGEECDEEFSEVIHNMGEYWYRTERISDNWWFYESKLELYPIL